VQLGGHVVLNARELLVQPTALRAELLLQQRLDALGRPDDWGDVFHAEGYQRE